MTQSRFQNPELRLHCLSDPFFRVDEGLTDSLLTLPKDELRFVLNYERNEAGHTALEHFFVQRNGHPNNLLFLLEQHRRLQTFEGKSWRDYRLFARQLPLAWCFAFLTASGSNNRHTDYGSLLGEKLVKTIISETVNLPAGSEEGEGPVYFPVHAALMQRPPNYAYAFFLIDKYRAPHFVLARKAWRSCIGSHLEAITLPAAWMAPDFLSYLVCFGANAVEQATDLESLGQVDTGAVTERGWETEFLSVAGRSWSISQAIQYLLQERRVPLTDSVLTALFQCELEPAERYRRLIRLMDRVGAVSVAPLVIHDQMGLNNTVLHEALLAPVAVFSEEQFKRLARADPSHLLKRNAAGYTVFEWYYHQLNTRLGWEELRSLTNGLIELHYRYTRSDAVFSPSEETLQGMKQQQWVSESISPWIYSLVEGVALVLFLCNSGTELLNQLNEFIQGKEALSAPDVRGAFVLAFVASLTVYLSFELQKVNEAVLDRQIMLVREEGLSDPRRSRYQWCCDSGWKVVRFVFGPFEQWFGQGYQVAWSYRFTSFIHNSLFLLAAFVATKDFVADFFRDEIGLGKWSLIYRVPMAYLIMLLYTQLTNRAYFQRMGGPWCELLLMASAPSQTTLEYLPLHGDRAYVYYRNPLSGEKCFYRVNRLAHCVEDRLVRQPIRDEANFFAALDERFGLSESLAQVTANSSLANQATDDMVPLLPESRSDQGERETSSAACWALPLHALRNRYMCASAFSNYTASYRLRFYADAMPAHPPYHEIYWRVIQHGSSEWIEYRVRDHLSRPLLGRILLVEAHVWESEPFCLVKLNEVDGLAHPDPLVGEVVPVESQQMPLVIESEDADATIALSYSAVVHLLAVACQEGAFLSNPRYTWQFLSVLRHYAGHHAAYWWQSLKVKMDSLLRYYRLMPRPSEEDNSHCYDTVYLASRTRFLSILQQRGHIHVSQNLPSKSALVNFEAGEIDHSSSCGRWMIDVAYRHIFHPQSFVAGVASLIFPVVLPSFVDNIAQLNTLSDDELDDVYRRCSNLRDTSCEGAKLFFSCLTFLTSWIYSQGALRKRAGENWHFFSSSWRVRKASADCDILHLSATKAYGFKGAEQHAELETFWSQRLSRQIYSSTAYLRLEGQEHRLYYVNKAPAYLESFAVDSLTLKSFDRCLPSDRAPYRLSDHQLLQVAYVLGDQFSWQGRYRHRLHAITGNPLSISKLRELLNPVMCWEQVCESLQEAMLQGDARASVMTRLLLPSRGDAAMMVKDYCDSLKDAVSVPAEVLHALNLLPAFSLQPIRLWRRDASIVGFGFVRLLAWEEDYLNHLVGAPISVAAQPIDLLVQQDKVCGVNYQQLTFQVTAPTIAPVQQGFNALMRVCFFAICVGISIGPFMIMQEALAAQLNYGFQVSDQDANIAGYTVAGFYTISFFLTTALEFLLLYTFNRYGGSWFLPKTLETQGDTEHARPGQSPGSSEGSYLLGSQTGVQSLHEQQKQDEPLEIRSEPASIFESAIDRSSEHMDMFHVSQQSSSSTFAGLSTANLRLFVPPETSSGYHQLVANDEGKQQRRNSL